MPMRTKTDLWDITITDRSGNQTAFISSSSGEHGLLSAKFKTDRVGGCGAMSMVLSRDHLDGIIDHGYLVEIRATPELETTHTLYYTGVVREVPDVGSTDPRLVYEIMGLRDQLESTLVQEWYEGADVDVIVKALHTAYYGDTDIDASQADISIDSADAYTMGDFEPEYVTWFDAMRLLGRVQTGAVWGVGPNRRVYFKTATTTNALHFFSGIDVRDVSIVSSSRDIINHYILNAKNVVGGAALILEVEDERSADNSITNYGRRTIIHEVPHIDAADLARYASELLTESQDPLSFVRGAFLPFSEYVDPTSGFVRITDRDDVEHSLPIQSVTYSLTPGEGLVGRLSIGSRQEVTAEDASRRIARGIALRQESSMSATRLAHSRDIEWMQRAMKDARRQGNKNYTLDPANDLHGINEDESYGLFHDAKRSYFGVGTNNFSRIRSISYRAIESPDIIRLHLDYDPFGRINFAFTQDLSDFFEQNPAGTWIVEDSTNKLIAVPISGLPFGGILTTKDPYKGALNIILEAGITDIIQDSSTTYNFYVYSYYNDATHYLRCNVRIRPGSLVDFRLQFNNGSGDVISSVSNRDSTKDWELQIYQRTFHLFTGAIPASFVQVREYGTDSWFSSATIGMPFVAGTGHPRIDLLGSSAGTVAKIDYFGVIQQGNQFPPTNRDSVAVSRDGFANGAAGIIDNIIASGDVNQNIDVSGTPAGTDLVINVQNGGSSAGRFYGLGMSW